MRYLLDTDDDEIELYDSADNAVKTDVEAVKAFIENIEYQFREDEQFTPVGNDGQKYYSDDDGETVFYDLDEIKKQIWADYEANGIDGLKFNFGYLTYKLVTEK